MDELFEGREPAPETEATCSDCAMLPKTGEARVPEHYNPRTKCCTYLPMLHNFLLGKILADNDPASRKGKATVEERLNQADGLTPLGLYAPAEYLARYDPTVKFGHDFSLRCPHYLEEEGGNCGVWKHRESTCSTWFCKYSTGDSGRALWREGIAPLLRHTELSLASWAAIELEAGPLDWGPWEGRPRALFAKCAELVDALSWKQIEELGGDELQTLAGRAKLLFSRVK